MDSPIEPKAGIALLEKMNLIEFAVEAAIIGDNGPLTSSPTQRRNMALVLADVAASFAILAARIDPLAEPAPEEKVIRWEALRTPPVPPTAPDPEVAPRFTLPPNAFEEAMERAEEELAAQAH